uniref:Uncharacterized protein n=1 Tax=Glossina austeni TaxID=7395 RepID=A0A1A9UHK6_GLOAU
MNEKLRHTPFIPAFSYCGCVQLNNTVTAHLAVLVTVSVTVTVTMSQLYERVRKLHNKTLDFVLHTKTISHQTRNIDAQSCSAAYFCLLQVKKMSGDQGDQGETFDASDIR